MDSEAATESEETTVEIATDELKAMVAANIPIVANSLYIIISSLKRNRDDIQIFFKLI